MVHAPGHHWFRLLLLLLLLLLLFRETALKIDGALGGGGGLHGETGTQSRAVKVGTCTHDRRALLGHKMQPNLWREEDGYCAPFCILLIPSDSF